MLLGPLHVDVIQGVLVPMLGDADVARLAQLSKAWHALAGAPPRFAHENHSAYERSSGVGSSLEGSTLRCC